MLIANLLLALVAIALAAIAFLQSRATKKELNTMSDRSDKLNTLADQLGQIVTDMTAAVTNLKTQLADASDIEKATANLDDKVQMLDALRGSLLTDTPPAAAA